MPNAKYQIPSSSSPSCNFTPEAFPAENIGRLHAYVCIEYRMLLPQQEDVVSRCRLQILSFFHLRKEEPKTKQEYKLCHLLNHVTDPLWFHRSSLKLKNKDNFVEYLKFCVAKQQRTLPIQLLILLCIIMNDNSGKDNLPWDKVSAPLVHGWRVLAGSGAGLEGEREKGRRSVFPIKSRGRKL